jgi:DMSO/TMAO reductase YedYZ molybdopterin-dependent catalytic subunit
VTLRTRDAILELVDGIPGIAADMGSAVSLEELQLATRNHGLPLEALRLPITPVGLHYLLIHYDIPLVDVSAWRLEVTGAVSRSLSLTLAELRAHPAREAIVTMECAGNGRALLSPRPFSQPWLSEAVGTARWRGTPLRGLLAEAGVDGRAVDVVFTGLDSGTEGGLQQQFERSLPLDEALRDDVLLAYEMNGQPLLPQHGFPLRLVVPGWYGMTNVKWLARITVVDRPFDGYQQARGYRLRQSEDEEGAPLTRMLPRALMAPPGIPDFPTCARTVALGPCRLEGRAWSGWGAVEAVEVSTDGGESWAEAALHADVASRWAWRSWAYVWRPPATGVYELCCRARDAGGNVQPVEPQWNVGGYANNAVQRVRVTVAGA